MSGGLFILVGIIVLVAVLASGSGNRGGEVVGNPDAEGASGTPIERVDTQEFEGSGGGEQSFRAGGGITLFRLTHSGSTVQNFIVSVRQDGDIVDQLVSVVGDFEGTKAVALPVGDYVMEVRPEAGEWTAQIDQEVPQEAPAPPIELSGTGQSATEFFALEAGPATFRLSNEDARDGPFIPALVRSDGTRISTIVNERGAYDSRETVEIKEAGIYLIDVISNGDWEIDVSQ